MVLVVVVVVVDREVSSCCDSRDKRRNSQEQSETFLSPVQSSLECSEVSSQFYVGDITLYVQHYYI